MVLGHGAYRQRVLQLPEHGGGEAESVALIQMEDFSIFTDAGISSSNFERVLQAMGSPNADSRLHSSVHHSDAWSD